MSNIDYARMQQVFPKQKAALTRAEKLADPEKRQQAVVKCAKSVITEWDAIGAWPDDWARWQRALDDAFPWGRSPRLDSIEFAS